MSSNYPSRVKQLCRLGNPACEKSNDAGLQHYIGASNHVFVIIHVKADEYWSNANGWIDDIRHADVYDHDSTMKVDLPIDGRWYALGKRIWL